MLFIRVLNSNNFIQCVCMRLHNNKLCSAATEVSGHQLMLTGVEAGYKASFNYVSSIT